MCFVRLHYKQLEKPKGKATETVLVTLQGVWRQEQGELSNLIECYPHENLSRENVNGSCLISNMIFFEVITSTLHDGTSLVIYPLTCRRQTNRQMLFRRVDMAQIQ